MTQAALTPAAGRGRARWGRRGPARGARGPASPAASAFPTAVPRETPGATGPLSLDPESPWPTLSVSLQAPTLRTAPALRSAALREPLRTPGSPRGTHPPCTRSAVPQASPSDPAAPSTPSTPSTPFAWERRGGAGVGGRGGAPWLRGGYRVQPQMKGLLGAPGAIIRAPCRVVLPQPRASPAASRPLQPVPPAQGRKPPGVGLLCEKVFRAGERSGGAVPRGRTLLWALRFLPLRQARGLSPQGHCLPPRGVWGQPGWGGASGPGAALVA